MTSRRCPVCGRGMFRPKALLRHIRRHHPEYYYTWIFTGRARTSEERKEQMRKLSEQKKEKRLKALGVK